MGDRGKKNSFFTQKIFVDRDSNPRPLREKHLPNQLSHRGVVIELNLKLGATHISLARFLVAPIYDWVPLPISQSLCVFLSRYRYCQKKIQKSWATGIRTRLPQIMGATLNPLDYEDITIQIL